MPQKRLQACRRCGKATRERLCDGCQGSKGNADSDVERERNLHRYASGLRQLYNSRAWRDRVREQILTRDPFCKIAVICGGEAFSTEVDHRIPADVYIAQHGGDPSWFYDDSNLQGACKADHSHKTALERQQGANR